MQFSLVETRKILQHTPIVLHSLLNDLDERLTNANEGENSWSPKEIVAHLIVCEKTNWITRAAIIVSQSEQRVFTAIDMTAHYDLARNTSLPDLLAQFEQLRKDSLLDLEKITADEINLERTAIHPKIGEVKLKQLLATWATHDLSHLAQIARVMAKQNKEAVGPFSYFLTILNS